jgi:hypothetical protein
MALDLMIVGAAKAGTSSVLAFLAASPQVQAQQQPEMTWFGDPDLYSRPFPENFYFGREPQGDRRRVGKLAGLMYRDGDVARLRDVSPDVIALAVLRDPVARAYSDYWFVRRQGREPLEDFGAALAAGDRGDDPEGVRTHFREGGLYADHLERLHRVLGADSVEPVVFEEFIADPRTALAPTLDRLGLDASFLPDEAPRVNEARAARSDGVARLRRKKGVVHLARRVLPSGVRRGVRERYVAMNETAVDTPPIDPETEAELRAFFAEPNHRLEALLRRSIPAWPSS